MWFIFALCTMVAWSGSDLFSKLGSRPNDKYSHWKIVMAVGLVMGLHAAFEIFVGGVSITFADILTYLPASAMYIVSMIFGYVGLRYIELSVSSPICNCSGALAAVLCFLFLGQTPEPLTVAAVALVALGLLGLGYAEMGEDEASRALRQQKANIKYSKSWLALALPVAYCLIDALGTFVDSVILREEPTGGFLDTLFPKVLDESVANVAYELTFLFIGVLAAFYVLVIRREKITLPKEGPKLAGAVFETAGQFTYIYAIGDTAHAGAAAAIISAYCALSVVWSSIFLKERLSWKHYLAIGIAFVGIVMLGFMDA